MTLEEISYIGQAVAADGGSATKDGTATT